MTDVATYSRALADRLHSKFGWFCLPTAYKVPLLKGWQKRPKQYTGPLWNKSNGCGIRTGESAGITVIDVDAPDREWFDRFYKHAKLEPTTWVETPGGGYHLYFKYDGRLPNGKFHKMNVDIRNDGGQIIAPESYYYSKDAAKSDRNGKKYQFREGHGFDKMRKLDDIFVEWHAFGIDRESFEIGKSKVVFEPPKVKKVRKRAKNQRAFMKLMAAYTKAAGDGYEAWLHGVWAICGASYTEGWGPPEELAKEWSSGDEAETIKKCAEYNPARGTFGIDFVTRAVEQSARDDFQVDFSRTYCYHDYVSLLRENFVEMRELDAYLKTAIVRVDRMGSELFYLRDRDGMWHPSGFPFGKGLGFEYLVPNQSFDPNKPVGPQNQQERVVETSMKGQLIKKQLSHVSNFEDLQYLPFYGDDDPTPVGTFNVFSGYKHEEFSDEDYAKHCASADFEFMMDHWRETMCNDNVEFFEYQMNWLAWLLRYGHKKPRTAIVMHGAEGLGKGLMWVDLVWHGILGKHLAHVITDMARFTANFNMQRLGKSLHIFNECSSIKSGSKVSWDKMKAIVTDRDITAEPKGKESFSAVDCAGVVLTGNHERLANLSNRDRRYACVEMSDKRLGDRPYFNRLNRVVKNTTIRRTFFSYLLRRDLQGYNMSDIPNTKSREFMKEFRNENAILHFLCKLVTGDLGDMDDRKREIYPTDFFSPERNEKILAPKGACWYSQDKVWKCFLEYLKHEGVPRKYHPRRTNVMRYLEKGGLGIRKRTDRSYHGTINQTGLQIRCWELNHRTIKKLHRTMLNNPTWEFPEITNTIDIKQTADFVETRQEEFVEKQCVFAPKE